MFELGLDKLSSARTVTIIGSTRTRPLIDSRFNKNRGSKNAVLWKTWDDQNGVCLNASALLSGNVKNSSTSSSTISWFSQMIRRWTPLEVKRNSREMSCRSEMHGSTIRRKGEKKWCMGLNRRLERRGETDRGRMQSFMGLVVVVGSNVRDHTGRTTGVESERLG